MKKLFEKLNYGTLCIINGLIYGLEIGLFGYATYLFVDAIKITKTVEGPSPEESDE